MVKLPDADRVGPLRALGFIERLDIYTERACVR